MDCLWHSYQDIRSAGKNNIENVLVFKNSSNPNYDFSPKNTKGYVTRLRQFTSNPNYKMAKPCKETDQSHFVLVWNGGSITHACLRVHSHAQTRNYIYFSEWAVLGGLLQCQGMLFWFFAAPDQVRKHCFGTYYCVNAVSSLTLLHLYSLDGYNQKPRPGLSNRVGNWFL